MGLPGLMRALSDNLSPGPRAVVGGLLLAGSVVLAIRQGKSGRNNKNSEEKEKHQEATKEPGQAVPQQPQAVPQQPQAVPQQPQAVPQQPQAEMSATDAPLAGALEEGAAYTVVAANTGDPVGTSMQLLPLLKKIQGKTGTAPSVIVQASLVAPTSSPIVKVTCGTKIVAGGEPGKLYDIAEIEKQMCSGCITAAAKPSQPSPELCVEPPQCIPETSCGAPKATSNISGKTTVVVASTGDPWGCSLELAELRKKIQLVTGAAPSLVVQGSLQAPPGKPIVKVQCGASTVLGGEQGKFLSVAETCAFFAEADGLGC